MDLDTKIKINEIFFSIQGESTWAGLPTIFIRTSGCPLRCTYCDTTYAYYEGTMKSIAEIVAELKTWPTCHRVCVTGGEPLAQSAVLTLLHHLCDLDYRVSLETSGALDCRLIDSRVKKIIDVKTPDSGEGENFNLLNLECANHDTEFKFVLCSEQDFAWAENFSTVNGLFEKSNVLYSPSFTQLGARWLAKKILSAGSPARLQLQLHKYIWSSDTRGV